MRETYAELAQALRQALRHALPALEGRYEIAHRDERAADQALADAYAANPTNDDQEYADRFGDMRLEAFRLTRAANDAYRACHDAEKLCTLIERLFREESAR